jgi:hypothetical protein
VDYKYFLKALFVIFLYHIGLDVHLLRIQVYGKANFSHTLKIKVEVVTFLIKHHAFLSSALHGSEKLHTLAALLLGKDFSNHCVGPRVGVDAVAKINYFFTNLPLIEPRSSSP